MKRELAAVVVLVLRPKDGKQMVGARRVRAQDVRLTQELEPPGVPDVRLCVPSVPELARVADALVAPGVLHSVWD